MDALGWEGPYAPLVLAGWREPQAPQATTRAPVPLWLSFAA